MAGTSTKTKPVAARVPVDLADWMETQGKAGDVIVQALTALRAGGVIHSREAELEAKVASLTEALAKSRKVSQSLMPMADRKPEKASGKLVADVLPVTGDQFPEQETWWQRQQRTKEKGR